MAQLWGGRFTKETDALFKQMGDSIYFDKRLWREDIRGSIAHAAMLGHVGVLTKEETKNILAGLSSIEKDIEEGRLTVTNDCEDIHSFVERELTARIGDDGKKLHTGRSRNDQVALDMRLWCRQELDDTMAKLARLLEVILRQMEENTGTFMPGFTHLQKAQPVTLAHHFGAYFEMFRRDYGRLQDCRMRMNECPLGAGALAGTTYPLDREYTAGLLDFSCATRNSMDSVSDRDYAMEFVFALCGCMTHLSRLSEEIILWNSNEYQFVELDDAYSTGSSIMPQKKNPDVAELIRGKSGRVYGDLMSLLTVMKGIPLAYDKDMQEDKEPVFDAVDTAKGCIQLMAGMLATMQFKKDRMEKSAMNGYTNATDAADYLVVKGIPFRDAHGIIGRMVLYGIEHEKPLDAFTIEEFRSFSEAFGEDIYDAISLKTCVGKRLTKGAPGEAAMQEEIREAGEWLSSLRG